MQTPVAKKSLGQNFLKDPAVVAHIAALVPCAGANVVEVWPGPGALTAAILDAKPKILTAVELDPRMVEHLRIQAKNGGLPIGTCDFRVVEADILAWEPPTTPYILFGNLPYYITSPIIRRFLWDVTTPPTAMVIMMQREVAEKVVPKNTQESGSFLGCLVGLRTESRRIAFSLPPSAFSPPPKVHSSVVVLTPKVRDGSEDAALKIASAGFAHPRKKLLSNLIHANLGISAEVWEERFREANLKPDIRAEAVTLEAWKILARPI